MSYSCKILLDSISETNKRLTTFEITFPRIVLAELNTHRMFSRNSASSRAIPFNKQIERVLENPFVPEQFPINCSGMQPQEYITEKDARYNFLRGDWLLARDGMIFWANKLANVSKVHKQIANRLLEPFMWHTVLVTATEFDNFFKLRTDENAQYEIRRIADLMYEAYYAFENPVNLTKCIDVWEGKRVGNGWEAIARKELKVGEWHLPLVYKEDYELIHTYLSAKPIVYYNEIEYNNEIINLLKMISVARCARISYLTHDGKRDIEADLNLYEKLLTSKHMSPFEHICTPYFLDKDKLSKSDEWKLFYYEQDEFADKNGNLRSGNMIGWKQHRKEIVGENCEYFRKST